MRHFLLLLIIITTACGPRQALAPASQPGPSHDHAVYDMDVSFDLDASSLTARSQLRFVADDSTARSYTFSLSPSLQIQQVRGTGVRGYEMESHEFHNVFTVELDGSVLPGSVATLEVEYSGSPSFRENMINEIAPDWVQLSIDSGWHPQLSHVRSVTGVVRLRLPPEWEVVGSGSARFENGAHVMHNTIPQPDVSFAAAPAMAREDAERFTVYYHEARRGEVQVVMEATESCGRYLGQRYGADDPMPHVHLVLAPRSQATFARKNFIPLSLFGNATPPGLHRFICHELAHYWASPDGFDPASHWMSEAFAEYVAGRSVRERFGDEEFGRWIARKEERGREHGPVWTPETVQRVPDPAMYDRAPYLLWRLEERIGKERFDAFVYSYMTERIGDTRVLLERLAGISGADTAEWFRRELATSGVFAPAVRA